jgi:hypothetical protein
MAGLILVLLGLAMALRDQSITALGYKVYTRSLLIFYVVIPLSLASSYASVSFKLSGQDPFLITSLSALFLAGILLTLGATLIVARQLKG